MKRLCVAVIRLYQIAVSPILPSSCRFRPTCSQYAIDAVTHHGIGRGLFMAMGRILRCHPWNPGGYDPVKR